MEIIGGQGVLKEFPGRSALLSAGVQNGPDAGVPLPAHRGAAALRDPAVDDQLALALLAAVVGGRHGRVEEKSENSIAMLAQPFSRRHRLGRHVLLVRPRSTPVFWPATCAGQTDVWDTFADFFQPGICPKSPRIQGWQKQTNDTVRLRNDLDNELC